MPNETPKSKCCDAEPKDNGGLIHVCSACGQMFVYRESETPSKEQIARQCTCGLHPHPQPNCPATKQPDDMPDVIYANFEFEDTFGIRPRAFLTIPYDCGTPYIRKSIHDEQITKLDAAIVELKEANRQANELIGAQANANDTLTTSLNDEITKLKSKLKECVELLEWVGTTGCGCESSKGFLDTQKAITSAKGLYE